LAGFAVTFYGRFSGDRRGQVRITARKIWISMAAGHPAAAVFAVAHQKLMGEMPLRV
jgi:alkylation response protein AidB-like acyl-CoA dehydrogenase